MTYLYLVRHGETLWNAEKRMQGHLNSDLTDNGKRQADLLGEKLANLPIEACYMSDSLRAVETAQRVTAQLALTPQADPRLREIGMGTWEGRTRHEIQQSDQQEWQFFWEAPHLFQGLNGGETFQTLETRSLASIKELVSRHPDQHVLVVTHRLTIKTLVNRLLKQPLAALNQQADVEPNSLSLLKLTPDRVTVSLYSDTSHYQ